MTEFMLVGEILKPQGVRGESKIKIYASNPDDFRRWKTLYFKTGETFLPIEAACSRVHDGFAYVTLAGCTTPEDVEKHRGKYVYIDRAHAGKLPRGMVYIVDLIGCEAIDENGNVIGTLTDVMQHGPVDTYVFKTPKGTMMAPAVKVAFPDVDVENRCISVNSERLNEVAVFED